MLRLHGILNYVFLEQSNGLSHGALYPLLILDFSNVNIADCTLVRLDSSSVHDDDRNDAMPYV